MSMVSNSLIFVIEKCHEQNREKGDPECADEAEIDQFVNRIYVSTISLTHRVDFSTYNHEEEPLVVV